VADPRLSLPVLAWIAFATLLLGGGALTLFWMATSELRNVFAAAPDVHVDDPSQLLADHVGSPVLVRSKRPVERPWAYASRHRHDPTLPIRVPTYVVNPHRHLGAAPTEDQRQRAGALVDMRRGGQR